MLNRKAIRAALESYKESLRQREAILKDKEIQGLFTQEKEQQARDLIAERFPNGRQQVVSKSRITLIETMTKNVPAWKGITAEDVLCAECSVFDGLVKLAEEV